MGMLTGFPGSGCCLLYWNTRGGFLGEVAVICGAGRPGWTTLLWAGRTGGLRGPGLRGR